MKVVSGLLTFIHFINFQPKLIDSLASCWAAKEPILPPLFIIFQLLLNLMIILRHKNLLGGGTK